MKRERERTTILMIIHQTLNELEKYEYVKMKYVFASHGISNSVEKNRIYIKYNVCNQSVCVCVAYRISKLAIVYIASYLFIEVCRNGYRTCMFWKNSRRAVKFINKIEEKKHHKPQQQ